MSQRKLIVLGTASQVPTRHRNHNAMFLLWDELGILFDPGDGTQRQLIHAGLSASQITHIAITHFHGDHCLGLAGIIQRISLDRVPHPVEVLFPADGQVFFERLRHASIYHDTTKLVPRPIEPVAGGLTNITRHGKHSIACAPLEHGVTCIGYRLQEDDGLTMLPERLAAAGVRGPAVRQLIDSGSIEVEGRTVRLEDVSVPKPGQSFAMVMDTRPCAGADALARGVDLLACESTYLSSEEREAHDHHHMTAAQAAHLARRGGARRLVLTHFSQRYNETDPFQQEAAPIFESVIAARDLSEIRVPERRPVG